MSAAGGQPAEAPEATVIPVASREELVSLLYEAAELEHGLSCSYLFAAFSLKRSEHDGLTADQVEAVTGWRHTIVEVAEQEMLHLALVANLLTALGASPQLRRPPFPQSSRYYPAGITIDLARFDDDTLSRFIFLERPDGVELDDEIADDPSVDLDAPVPEAAPAALVAPDAGASARVAAERYSTVGHLYQTIEDGLAGLVAERGEAEVFIGPPPAQATRAYFRFSELVPVTDLASARQALEVLTTQGEGVRGDWTEAHYGKFLTIRDELRARQRDEAGFEPAWPVVANPVVDEPVGGAPGRLVTGPLAASVMQLFNGAYALMTSMLLRFFAHQDESEAALRALAASSVELMEHVIAPLGTLLPRLSAGPEHGEATAGASFELSRSITLLPHRGAAWRIFAERLDELGGFSRRLGDGDAGPAVLRQVGDALFAVRDQLDAHR